MKFDSGENGFTLLETLLAFLILSIILGASLQTIALSIRSYNLSKEVNDVLRLSDEARLDLDHKHVGAMMHGASQRDGREYSWTAEPHRLAETNKFQFIKLLIQTPSGRQYEFLYASAP
ncbi:hypothetical protein BJF93_08010 [Xaviernesmea oryzae]|uniref:Prepilin-type N-terminal cleavage/methylation domain-containing protein n=1 Tax=Xaviernesmea oryzae TaxID=464029 RepID=A0A1Q9AWB7_9HYPH|nr:prepilin-type N-terminal cleavage/methylation domain-containing protein [Xaviernesmea oryzae]OLP59705.1 hypothetical protein BJF93_08010 [Xaviernesmea oryzae]SEM35632.1 hypothetical protein SAMN04487976_13211 [Xaviernesmea oryzae]